MEDGYAISDLRQFIAGRNFFPPPQPQTDMRGASAHTYPYDMLGFRSDSAPGAANGNNMSNVTAASSNGGAVVGGGFESLSGGGDGGGMGRWPRQETLTLLEIRSRLDAKFKEANQKGPLWEEVSRIMSDEHGYLRSGRKCREKFENLYKYYKKTKEGKAGRQDGKNYRFFRQLEALYGGGEHNNHNHNNNSSESQLLRSGGSFNSTLHNNEPSFLGTKLSEPSLSLSNYSEPDTTSSEDTDRIADNDDDDENDPHSKKRRVKKKNMRSWKVKIRDFIDEHMKKLMDKQEVWMNKMMRSMEDKELDRMRREEEWRKQDAARIEREHEFWARERAWIESRDAALMDALHKMSGKETVANTTTTATIWPECEINKLIQLRTSMEVKFQQRGGSSEEMLWEEIAAKMAFFGHERSSMECKEKWDSVNNFVLKCSKRRGDNNSKGYYDPVSASPQVYSSCQTSEQGLDHNTIISLNGGNSNESALSENCFRYFIGDAYERVID